MHIPGLGAVDLDDDGSYFSEPSPIPVLGDASCRLVVDGYEDDPAKEDFHAAIMAFRGLDRSALVAAQVWIFEYYRDVVADWGQDDLPVLIESPESVLDHIHPGGEAIVQRDADDQRVYISIECECDWEPEHGLQIVFQDGTTVTKVGPYDGHLTNAAAYGRPDFRGVIYAR